MKVAIQGLGTVPTTVLMVLEQEKPDVSYVICSDYQLKYVAKDAGFDRPNEELIREKAEAVGSRVEFKICDVFDPTSVGEVLGNILSTLDSQRDEVIVNYTGGTAVVRLLLGTTGVVISNVMKAKVLYAIRYPESLEISENHTEALRSIFEKLRITT